MSTTLTGFRVTGWPAFAALSSGNLLQVAETLRARYPEAELVVLGERGRGEIDARRAVEGTDARLALPAFAPEARINDQIPTDFNDMAVLSGMEHMGEFLRDLVFREVEVTAGARALTERSAIGVMPDNPMEDAMGGVKEVLVNEAETGSRRRTSKRGASKAVETAGSASSAPAGATPGWTGNANSAFSSA